MNDQIKEKILASIETAKQKGYTLVSEEFGDESSKCACALGCVAVANGFQISENLKDVAGVLQVSDQWINSFIYGFDGIGWASGAEDPDAWKMGQDIASETKPVSYQQFFRLHGDKYK